VRLRRARSDRAQRIAVTDTTNGIAPLPGVGGGRFPFPGLPTGWYAVATGREVPAGRVVARRYFGRELVIWRTRSGALRVSGAFCPHLGAHLGRAGRVEGELLRCGFHGFRFDGSGRCVATPGGGEPPARARLALWEAREQDGLVLVWFDPLSRAPAWEVPALEGNGWSALRWRRYRIATTPQEITENSVDLEHFAQLHGFTGVSSRRPVTTDGPHLRSGYLGTLPLGVPGLPKPVFQVDYDVRVWGLGYSLVHVSVAALRIAFRMWVLPVPIDEQRVDLILATSVPARLGPLAPLVRRYAHRVLCREVEQDLEVWNHKIFLEQPALAKGEQAVARYRSWARQFYARPAGDA
jgi:phenylpropionate dioxygenase-like ring-hydroxylating dioxygenase large terminal subunit